MVHPFVAMTLNPLKVTNIRIFNRQTSVNKMLIHAHVLILND